MTARQSNDAELGVEIDARGSLLAGVLYLPSNAVGIVLFAHGSGSGRHSPRNRFVAERLQSASLATLLIDLLTEEEERIDNRTKQLRFDIPLLADRLGGAVEWLAAQSSTTNLRVGIFGASTGGGAAIVAAARNPARIGAIVSRGGRPDLAGDTLADAVCPTLFIVGERDGVVIDLNRQALAQLGAPIKELIVIPGAGHLFEEPGALPEVARLAADWFVRYLGTTASS